MPHDFPLDATYHAARAQLVVPCDDLDAAIAFYTDQLGFRLHMIMPADAPRIAVMSGSGITLRLERSADPAVPHALIRLHLAGDPECWPAGDDDVVVAPGGVRIERAGTGKPATPTCTDVLIQRASDDAAWVEGRAGMHYRDLVPGRLGGALIASHIRIPEGGPVADYVHYHRVGLQMIFCRRGWVKVVYEDQGPPFVMHAGDCVLQPPTIRHRVLESSAGLEVVEIGSPAEHETWRDHELDLPNPDVRPQRRFAGQRFVRHIAAEARWQNDTVAGIEFRDTGIAAATDGLADVRVFRVATDAESELTLPVGEAHFLFVLKGQLRVRDRKQVNHTLMVDDACLVPAGANAGLAASAGSEYLQAVLPER
ncbi:MAG: cupin domain-containing protein [Rhodanobacteraceae bacterium]